MKSKEEIVQCLNVETNIADHPNLYFIILAVQNNHYEMVKILCHDSGADLIDLTKTAESGITVLHEAVRVSNPQILKLLLDMGKVDVNSKAGKNEDTPLHWCISSQIGWDEKDARNCDNFKCFMLLMKNKDINPTIVNRKKLDVFYFAGVKHKKFEMVNYFARNTNVFKKFNTNFRFDIQRKNKGNVLMEAVKLSQPHTVKLLLENCDFDINTMNKKEETVMHICAKYDTFNNCFYQLCFLSQNCILCQCTRIALYCILLYIEQKMDSMKRIKLNAPILKYLKFC